MTQNNKYANGKIYKITDNAYTKCYIGSTIQPLSSRIGGHRRDYKRYLDGKHKFITSFALFEEFGVENCKIELIEAYPCENLEHLLKKEGEYIRSIECVNKNVVGRTKTEQQSKTKAYNQEYRRTNITKLSQQSKQYREENQEYMKEQKKQYYERIHLQHNLILE